MKLPLPSLFALLSAALLAGCASIMGSPNQLVPISSVPSDAAIVITDETGAEIFKGATPTNVTLQKSTGHYWGKKSYTVTISKPGFSAQTIAITASANGWYIGGNLLFGGLIGWFVVDPFSGSMYTLSPENISASLPAGSAHNNTAKDGSIAVLLLQDVPAELRDKMQRIR